MRLAYVKISRLRVRTLIHTESEATREKDFSENFEDIERASGGYLGTA